jgi:hypothetical protein
VPQIDPLISVKGELLDGRDLTSRQVWKLVDTPDFVQTRNEVYTEVSTNSAFRTHVWLQLRDQVDEIR